MCETVTDSERCGWSLFDVVPTARGVGATSVAVPVPVPGTPIRCRNGHAMRPGDLLCSECGNDVAATATDGSLNTDEPRPEQPSPPGAPLEEPRSIDGWEVVRRLRASSTSIHYEVRSSIHPAALLTLYHDNAEPDRKILETLQRQPQEHVERIYAVGRWQSKAFCVAELVRGGTLADYLRQLQPTFESATVVLREVGTALASFAEIGLRHRSLQPTSILVRTELPLDLVITGFDSARLSDLDLDVVSPLQVSRYSAPEAIVGAVSASSDWWSLGVILLEHVSRGSCFSDISDQAFMLSTVTRGIAIPSGIDPRIDSVLHGLLSRDPSQRWQWPQLSRWLGGEAVDSPARDSGQPEPHSLQPLTLGARSYFRADDFALAAADGSNWEEGQTLAQRGVLSTWVSQSSLDAETQSGFRRAAALESVGADSRHALMLQALNTNLPLSVRGDIVTPDWLLRNSIEAYEIISSPVVSYLRQSERERWLVQIADRVQRMRDRAKSLEIALDEERFHVTCLASSRPRLEAMWDTQRQLLPDSDHAGIASLLDRTTLSEEDLILLLSAAHNQFEPTESILQRAGELASKYRIGSFDRDAAAEWLGRSRRAIYEELETRLTGFARCGEEEIDNWADVLRVQRRTALPRLLIMLSIAADRWHLPPRQQYIENLLEFFEKRAASLAQRGPLVRMIIGKTTARVDLHEFGTAKAAAVSMLDRFISRVGEAIRIEPTVLIKQPETTQRLRQLQEHAKLYRRDTGVDGLYLGFPFVVMRSATTPRPRILPLLLWPARIDLEIGNRSDGSFAFDLERSDVRINPATHTLLSQDEGLRLRDQLDELLQANSINVARVMDVFGAMIPSREQTLVRLPSKDYMLADRQRQLVCAAVLFHAEFMGQAIAEDLHTLRTRSVAGTALDAAIRSQATPPVEAETPERVPELERFPVTDSDPSQDAAVIRARQSPGLLIEGPPGTGKSQTIVNIVSDCIGRRESVLIVCQKQVAIQVVAKRLEADGIGGRAFVVGDLGSDRTRVLTGLRDQLDRIVAEGQQRVERLQGRRNTLAQRIQSLETEIDQHHAALNAVDPAIGLSYRSVLGELIEIDEAGGAIEAPVLRSLLGPLAPAAIAGLQDALEPPASVWLESRYENNPLAATRVFNADAAVTREFRREFVNFVTAEAARRKQIVATPEAFEVDAVGTHESWLEANDSRFTRLDASVRHNLGLWFDLFDALDGADAAGVAALAELERLLADIKALDSTSVEEQRIATELATELSKWAASDCEEWRDRATYLRRSTGAMAFFNPIRIVAQIKINRFLKQRRIVASRASAARIERACALELQLRPLREVLVRNLERFTGHGLTPDTISARGLELATDRLIELLRPLRGLVASASACPLRQQVRVTIKTGQAEAYIQFAERYRGGIRRAHARQASRAALHSLRNWFTDEWLRQREADLHGETVAVENLTGIAGAIPTLTTYQNMRRRAGALSTEALQCLEALRRYERELISLPAADVGFAVRQTIARESRLAWKDRLEQLHPALSLDRDSLAGRVTQLEDLDGKFIELNRQLLAADSGLPQPPTKAVWESVTRLRGPRARRLREVFEAGREIGLLGLRPVWLMNPDTASRVLPLRPGLFDVVIFDEASQIPVEHALPSLYRAKRMVVSGDEKQMPPTSFFSSRVENDEDELFDADEIDDAVTETARAEIEDRWNRREVKDCEDLLTLSRACLPAAMLKIHYRSSFRELINFSNAAYYGGDLYVPVQNPEDRVRRDPPIVVQRVNGMYKSQTNAKEADAVVDVVDSIWKAAGEARPSIGVVTFNRKQADLILERLEQRAERDSIFRRTLSGEGQRRQDNEDMSFFVKNVENVQGDERDVVIFSTTFGRNESGTFRRSFGVLGQQGGERRLNVAVTRAREKIILVTSMPINEISDMMATGRPPSIARDYLQAYLGYAAKVSDGDLASAQGIVDRCRLKTTAAERSNDAADDGLVRSVGAFLRSLGVRAEPTTDGLFGVDFALQHPVSGGYIMGIECDSPQHSLLKRSRARDVWRPKVLHRSLPKLHRVSVHAWYHDRTREQERLEVSIRGALAEEGQS